MDHNANLTERNDGAAHALTGVLFANRAAVLLKLERYEEAETDCRRALQRTASAKLLARCAIACVEQASADKYADAFGCVAEALMLEPQHAVSRKVLGDIRNNAPGGRLLRPDADYLARLKSRLRRRGESGYLGYGLAYFNVLELLAPEDSTEFIHMASQWQTALGGRIPEPVHAGPVSANSPTMDPNL